MSVELTRCPCGAYYPEHLRTQDYPCWNCQHALESAQMIAALEAENHLLREELSQTPQVPW